MKRILFIIPTLGNGGAEKSLLSVLQNINYNEYSVDILAMRPEGLIAGMIPVNVNFLPMSETFMIFTKPLSDSVITFLKMGKVSLAYKRIKYSSTLKKYGMNNVAEQHAFKYFSCCFEEDYGHYAAVISYLEKTTNYIAAQMIDADVKIGYIHSDYNKLKTDAKLDEQLMKNLDYLVTVSDSCSDILKKALPEMADKIRVVENIVSKDYILSEGKSDNPYCDGFAGTRITTVGRVSHEKGPDIALEACKMLKENGYDVKWHWIGSVNIANFEEEINRAELKDIFITEGLKKNPYKYVYNSDIYVQPSRFEGKSIAIEEAKVLGVPVALTGFTTASSQINDHVNGVISKDISAQSLYCEIAQLIDDSTLYNKLKNNLKDEKGNSGEIEKLLALINNG